MFDGMLDTPGGKIALCTVYGDRVVTADVPRDTTRIHIWANDGQEPDEVFIRVG